MCIITPTYFVAMTIVGQDIDDRPFTDTSTHEYLQYIMLIILSCVDRFHNSI